MNASLDNIFGTFNDSNEHGFNLTCLDLEMLLEAHLSIPPVLPYIAVGMYGPLVVLSTVANLIVLVTIIARLRSAHFFFIALLAIADIWLVLISGTITPFYMLGDKWLLGPIACSFVPLVQGAGMLCSVYFLTVIAVDRHTAIVRTASSSMSLKTAAYISMLILICSIVLSGPVAWQTSIHVARSPLWGTQGCGPFCFEHWDNKGYQTVYGIIIFVISLILPMLIIGYSYSKSAVQIRKMAAFRLSPQVRKAHPQKTTSIPSLHTPNVSVYITGATSPASNQPDHVVHKSTYKMHQPESKVNQPTCNGHQPATDVHQHKANVDQKRKSVHQIGIRSPLYSKNIIGMQKGKSVDILNDSVRRFSGSTMRSITQEEEDSQHLSPSPAKWSLSSSKTGCLEGNIQPSSSFVSIRQQMLRSISRSVEYDDDQLPTPASPKLSLLLNRDGRQSRKLSRRAKKNLKKLRRTTFILFLMITTFIVCWTPLKLYQLLSFDLELTRLIPYNYLYIIGATTHWLAMLSTLINPLLYGVGNTRVRENISRSQTETRL